MTSRPRDSLPIGTVLDCYRITKLIGSGGCSLIYLAEDEDNHDEVAIKEYLPKRFGARLNGLAVSVVREEKHESFQRGRRLFYQEARVLANLRHPNIVHVRNCFLANNTAYLVMNYEPGKNLGRYIKKREGGLSTNFLMTVFPPLLDALELIHSRQHLHLDIKPSNIHLRPGGNPLLLDFGAVYHLDDVGEKKAQVVTPGPPPHHHPPASAKVGPPSQDYAVGAPMRACIAGKPPPTAADRHAKDDPKSAIECFGEHYPREVLESIDWAMQIDAANRPRTAAELRDALLGRIPAPKPLSDGKLEAG